MKYSNQSDCVMIVVPYRNREQHLREFIPYMETFLGSQRHRFVVVEQCDDKKFNRARLMNIGFTAIRDATSCVCFHDVDLLPLDDARYYNPVQHTTHIAGRLEQYGFVTPYPEYMGGVFLSPVDEFCAVDGFSNEYWGWGNEEDELFARYLLASIIIDRQPGRYHSMPHQPSTGSSANAKRLLQTLELVAELPLDQARRSHLREVQSRYKTAWGVAEVEPRKVEADGLSTLTYNQLARIPLREGFPFLSDISSSHELIRVCL